MSRFKHGDVVWRAYACMNLTECIVGIHLCRVSMFSKAVDMYSVIDINDGEEEAVYPEEIFATAAEAAAHMKARVAKLAEVVDEKIQAARNASEGKPH